VYLKKISLPIAGACKYIIVFKINAAQKGINVLKHNQNYKVVNMSAGKIMSGYILYAIGIIGGVEGVVDKSIPISAVAIIVIIIASFLLKPE